MHLTWWIFAHILRPIYKKQYWLNCAVCIPWNPDHLETALRVVYDRLVYVLFSYLIVGHRHFLVRDGEFGNNWEGIVHFLKTRSSLRISSIKKNWLYYHEKNKVSDFLSIKNKYSVICEDKCFFYILKHVELFPTCFLKLSTFYYQHSKNNVLDDWSINSSPPFYSLKSSLSYTNKNIT